jgi:hypothetical protein
MGWRYADAPGQAPKILKRLLHLLWQIISPHQCTAFADRRDSRKHRNALSGISQNLDITDRRLGLCMRKRRHSDEH